VIRHITGRQADSTIMISAIEAVRTSLWSAGKIGPVTA
jgi:hypothetical protein